VVLGDKTEVKSQHVIYVMGMVRGSSGGPPPKPTRAMREEFDKAMAMPREQRHEAMEKYLRDFQPFQDAMDAWVAKQKYLSFVVKSDGRFRIDDVEAGDYTLAADVADADSQKVLGTATTRFSVGEMSGGRSDEVLDLGDVGVVEVKGK
jgi:hypothetical protein